MDWIANKVTMVTGWNMNTQCKWSSLLTMRPYSLSKVYHCFFWMMLHGSGSPKPSVCYSNMKEIERLYLGALRKEERERRTTVKTTRHLDWFLYTCMCIHKTCDICQYHASMVLGMCFWLYPKWCLRKVRGLQGQEEIRWNSWSSSYTESWREWLCQRIGVEKGKFRYVPRCNIYVNKIYLSYVLVYIYIYKYMHRFFINIHT